MYKEVQFIVIYVAMQESFLSDLKEVRPELCITAAYGNILPQRFLDIPPCGKS
jgi:methionyl-tRNA formyltransferase